MAAIKGCDTKPELIIRKALHRAGVRYRLHAKDLPGKPDLVLPRYDAAIFIHGCFWHKHICHLFKWPVTRQEFWKKKIEGNVANDCKQIARLHETGWRTLIIWECALKGKHRLPMDNIIQATLAWLQGEQTDAEIRGESVQ